MKELEGGCQVPIGVNSSVQNDKIFLSGMVATIDGNKLIKDKSIGNIKNPEEVGKKLAEKLKVQGADRTRSCGCRHYSK